MTQNIEMTKDIEVGREGAVMWAAFARPQKKNAITGAMYDALIEAFEAAERDAERQRVRAERQGGRVHGRERPWRFCRSRDRRGGCE